MESSEQWFSILLFVKMPKRLHSYILSMPQSQSLYFNLVSIGLTCSGKNNCSAVTIHNHPVLIDSNNVQQTENSCSIRTNIQ